MAKMGEIPPALFTSKLFEGLTIPELQAVVRKGVVVNFSAGSPVINENDDGEELYCIATGKLDVQTGASDDPIALLTLGPADVLGEMMLLERQRRSATVVAKTDADLLRWYYKDYLDLFGSNPVLGYKIMRNLANMLAGRLEETNKALKRVASV